MFAQLCQLAADHFEQLVRVREDGTQPFDELEQILVLADDLVLLEAREAMQAQIQDGLGLGVGKLVLALGAEAELGREAIGARGLGAGGLQHGGHQARGPVLAHEADLGFRRPRRALDERDHFVDICQRDRQTF